jgi:hypothetical protein
MSSMFRHSHAIAALSLLGAAACAPQNAQLTEGEYIVFLAESTSRTILFDAVSFDELASGDPSDEGVETFQIDCRCELVSVLGDDATCEDADAFGGSCTSCAEFFPEEGEELENPNDAGYLTDLCWAPYHTIYDEGIPIDGNDDEQLVQWVPNPWDDSGNGAPRFAYELWLHRDKFRVVKQKLEPWRGEAIITTEGDFHVTFHHTVGGSDFRFAFVIDPDFQPQECVGSGESVAAEPVDGDWLGAWSEDIEEGDGTLYYLNAGAYQFNPSNIEDAWFLPNDWRAGYAEAKFGEEQLFIRGARYGNPFAYEEYEALGDLFGQAYVGVEDLFYFAMPADDNPDTDTVENDPVTADIDGDGVADYTEMGEVIETIVADTKSEIEAVGWEIAPKAHLNDWRAPDGIASGLDGWGELHYNWVQIDAGSVLEVGGSASGSFELTMQATDSQSRMFIKGSFVVDKIKKERWGAYDIDAIKIEENGTELCVPR